MRRPTSTRIAVTATLVGGIVLGAVVLNARRIPESPLVVAEPVTRGSVVRTVAAVGTLEAVTTVEVGTQISGAIQTLHADFNAIVRKGQVLARLDPALYQSAIEQARANRVRAEADLDRLRVGLADAEVKRDRARELAARQLLPATELEAAEVNVRSAAAQVRSQEAQVAQADAALRHAEVNLSKTVITSPIDGIVIARNVDVGQTVAASLQAPTLFVLAAGLDQMQVRTSIDEADLGDVADGQPVTFTVDAYPQERFTGVVRQVRLNPVVEQNVVTYAGIISAPNPELKLKPGMTAHVTIEVARRDDVLRVPSAALRFRPTDDLRTALGAEGVTANGPAVWQYLEEGLRPASVTVGISDGSHTEVAGGGLTEDSRVVTRVAMAPGAGTAARAGANPLMPSGPARPR
jgi:HlyD family secretion protein